MTDVCKRTVRPAEPGEILVGLYLEPHNVTITSFADAAGISRKHMSAIVNSRSAITACTAERIAAVLGTTAQYWLNLQNSVDLYDAAKQMKRAARKPHRLDAFAPAYAMAAAAHD